MYLVKNSPDRSRPLERRATDLYVGPQERAMERQHDFIEARMEVLNYCERNPIS